MNLEEAQLIIQELKEKIAELKRDRESMLKVLEKIIMRAYATRNKNEDYQ